MLCPIAVFVRDSADLSVGFIDGNGTGTISPQFSGSGHCPLFFNGFATLTHTGFQPVIQLRKPRSERNSLMSRHAAK